MGTISLTLPSDGSTAEVSDYNTPINTIKDEFNGNIDNDNIKANAGIAGTKLADSAITTAKIADANVTPVKWTNPYKFRANRATNWTVISGLSKVPFNTENYDTNNNFDSTTNYRYTAPVNGYYSFKATVMVSVGAGDFYGVVLYKNGSLVSTGNGHVVYYAFNTMFVVTDDLQLTAGDYIEVFFNNGSAPSRTGLGGSSETYFSGFLISQT